MVIGSSLSIAKAFIEQIIPCVEVEALIKSTSIIFTNNKRISLFKCNKIREELFLATLGKMMELERGIEVKRQMFTHLELHQFTNQTLTDSEFESHFILSDIGYVHKDYLLQHNHQYLVLFMNGYKNLLRHIFILREYELTRREIQGDCVWINEMVRRHQDVRKLFPLCYDFQYHTEEKCLFLAEVSSNITSHLSSNDTALNTSNLQEYFVMLEIECLCPSTLNDLIT